MTASWSRDLAARRARCAAVPFRPGQPSIPVQFGKIFGWHEYQHLVPGSWSEDGGSRRRRLSPRDVARAVNISPWAGMGRHTRISNGVVGVILLGL